MPTSIYKKIDIHTIDGIKIEVSPLKIKYLKKFMETFDNIKDCQDDDETLIVLCECVKISMEQYYPELAIDVDTIQDNFDMYSIYEILDIAAGIKLNKTLPQESGSSNDTKEESSWENLDLAKLETEIFMIGAWKNYDELESSISIQELMSIISTKRELDFEEKKFLAALQGVDIGGGSDSDGKERGQKEWEDLKARVFSGGATSDSKDILALQGQNAVKAGFGIGMGLDYTDLRDPEVLK